jgi:hypothetical protein
MNNLTTELEKFKPEIWKTLTSPAKGILEPSILSNLASVNQNNMPEADYTVSIDQFKNIFNKNISSSINDSRNFAIIFAKIFSMLKGTVSEVEEAIEITKDIVKHYSSRIAYYYLINRTDSVLFEQTFGITKNKETYKIICDKYIADVIDNPEEVQDGDLYYDVIDPLSYVYKGIEDTLPDAFKEYLYNAYYIDKKSDFDSTLSIFMGAENIFVEIFKKENPQALNDYMTKGSTLINLRVLSLNFKNKDEVFEIIDQIDEKYVDYYKGRFAIPKGGMLTDEDLDIYGEFLSPSEVIDNVTIDQAIKYNKIFPSNIIIQHKDFTLDNLKDVDMAISDLNSLLQNNNYLQADLIKNADQISIRQLNIANCIITSELFKVLYNREYAESEVTSLQPLSKFIQKSVKKKNFNSVFLNEIQKIYGCSTLDIFDAVVKNEEYDTYMDDKTKKAFIALNKLYE